MWPNFFSEWFCQWRITLPWIIEPCSIDISPISASFEFFTLSYLDRYLSISVHLQFLIIRFWVLLKMVIDLSFWEPLIDDLFGKCTCNIIDFWCPTLNKAHCIKINGRVLKFEDSHCHLNSSVCPTNFLHAFS